MTRAANFALLVLGCVRASVAPPVVAPTAAAPTEMPAAPALVARMREIADTLAPQGVRFEGEAARGFIAHNGHVTTALDVPAGRCLSVVSLATAGVHDLDARLFDPSGDMLVEDVEADAHPTVQICAETPRRVFHVIDAFEGHGAYLVARFVTDRRGLDALARVVGGRPGTAGLVGAARSELERRVNELRDGIARRGFQPTGDPVRVVLAAGARMRAAFPVSADRCYTFAAFAGDGLTDLNLGVLDPAGDLLARDLRRERDGFAQLCPTTAATLAVEAVAVDGSGDALLTAWSADAAAFGGANALWLGERLGWAGSARSLEETITVGRERLRTMGFTSAGGSADANLRLASGDVHDLVRAGRARECVGVLASGGRGTGRVFLELLDAEGNLVARGAQGEGGALAVACDAQASLRARVWLEAGAGEVRLGDFMAPVPGWATGLDAPTVGEAFAASWVLPGSGFSARGVPERVRVGGGTRWTRTLERAAGRCLRATLVAARGTPSLGLDARSEGGTRLASAVSEARVSLHRCGATAERVVLEGATQPSTATASEGLLLLWDAVDATSSP